MRVASEVAAGLGLRRLPENRGWSGDCPACHYAGAFSIRERDGKTVWWCASCGDHGRDRLAEVVLGGRASGPRQASTVPADRTDHAARTRAALRLWDAALLDLEGPVAIYLGTRGLSVPDGGALRFLPRAKHPSCGAHPCMIALAVNAAGEGQAVHRTYLAPGGEGKAALDPPRATLGPVGGAVVRLSIWKPGLPLVIGEGVETSLSAGVLLGAPAWAGLSAGGLANAPLPEGLLHLLIAADADPPGQRAAWTLADRAVAQGLRAEVLTPDAAGEDFNDILKRQTARGTTHA